MRNEGGGFAANIYGAMPENSIQVTSHSVLIPAFKLVMATLSRIVIPSAAEGSFLHCGQYRIGTGRETMSCCHVYLRSHRRRLSVCKEDFSLTLEMTMRESSSH